MHVQIRLLDEMGVQPNVDSMRTDIAERSLGRFLHHITELARELKIAFAVHARGLDIDSVATVLGHNKTARDSYTRFLDKTRVGIRGQVQVGRKVIRVNGSACKRLLLLNFRSSYLAANPDKRAFESPYSGFSCVLLDNRQNGTVIDRKVFLLQSMLLHRLRKKEMPSYLLFLLVRVSRQGNDLHAVEEGRWNRLRYVRRRQEQDLRKVKWDFDIVVAELRILFWIKSLEQSSCRVAPEIRSNLVDLIQKEYWILGPCLLDSLNNAPWHSSNIGSAVSAHFRLVPYAAEGDMDELSVERLRDGFAQRCLANARRPDKTKNRTLGLVRKLAHCKILEYPVLNLFKPIVVLVQDLARTLQVNLVGSPDVPWEANKPVQICSDDGALWTHGRRFRQSGQLFFDLVAGVGRHMDLLELLPVLSYLAGLLTLFTEFFLDCSDLLAEVVLSLGLVDLGFHVALDLPCKFQHIDLFGEEFGDAVKSFFCIRCSKQRLPVFGPEQKAARNKVCEPVGFRDAGDIVHRLRRQFPGQLDVLRKLVENNTHESLALR